MNLQEFFDYKNQLMGDLLTKESVVHLINKDVPFEDSPTLAYTQVFPYEYVPSTIEEAKTFVCFDVDVQKSFDGTFLLPVLYIWVFTHRSLLKLPEGGVRVDSLCSEICSTINGSLMYGLGKLNLYSTKRFAPMTDYQGKCMTFYAKDFNRQYDPHKTIPSKRKD